MVAKVIGICSLIAIVFGVYTHFDNRYTLMTTHNLLAQESKTKYDLLAQDVKRIERENEYRFQAIRLQTIKDMIYKLKERYAEKKMDQTGRDHLKKLEDDKLEIEEKMKKLEDKR